MVIRVVSKTIVALAWTLCAMLVSALWLGMIALYVYASLMPPE